VSICTRLCLYGLTLSTGLSLLASFLIAPPRPQAPAWSPRWEAISGHAWTSRSDRKEQRFLIDRGRDRPEPLSLPADCLWGMVSVSPWAGVSGELEAVAPCHRGTSGGEPFCGLARIGLPAGNLIEEVPLDVLPTGRPCWVPGRPGRVLFAAGDGRLYTHDFEPTAGAQRTVETARDPVVTSPVSWRCEPSGPNLPYIADPSWSVHPRLRHLLVALVIPTADASGREAPAARGFWWFEIEPDGGAVRDAGPLFDLGPARPGAAVHQPRFPVLTASPEGAVHLVYLARVPGTGSVRLEAVPVTLAGDHGKPSVEAGARPVVLCDDAALSPPVLSGDDRSVFYLSTRANRPVGRRPLAPEVERSGTGIVMAGRR
jgi:hypothetical protein